MSGWDSSRHLAKERALMAGLASSLKVPSDEVPGGGHLVERLKTAERSSTGLRLAGARASAANAASAAEQVGSVRPVAQRMAAGMTAADLRSLVGDIRGRLGSEPGVVVLIAESEVAVLRRRDQSGRPGCLGCGPAIWWSRWPPPSAAAGR
jgi:alanyl-tRNA synthetase